MIEGASILTTSNITVAGLYIILIVLLYFERLVPIGRLRDEQKTTAYWRGIAETKDKTIATLTEAVGLLTNETAPTMTKVIGAIQDKAAEVDSR